MALTIIIVIIITTIIRLVFSVCDSVSPFGFCNPLALITLARTAAGVKCCREPAGLRQTIGVIWLLLLMVLMLEKLLVL